MLEKIKDFFRNLFKINNQQCLDAPKENIETVTNFNKIENNTFKNQLIADDKFSNEVIKLQKDYKSGIINEDDLTEEEFDNLSKLYYSQIKKTKESIENYKNKILKIKAQLS